MVRTTISATVVSERIQNHYLRNWLHASPQSNGLPLVYINITDQYQDADQTQSRVGYIGRIDYSYANRYFIEASARRDASYLFAPGFRVGYFPGVSAGWRVTEEPFFRKLLNNKNNVLSDLKFRGSYGQLGDDRMPTDVTQPIIANYAYLQGYNYGTDPAGNAIPPAILDGNTVVASRDKGVPITTVSWTRSKITDVGVDYSLFSGKITGTFDYFYRKRTGLPVVSTAVVLPLEIGYGLSQENLNSDAQYGEEGSIAYNGKIGQLNFTFGGNLSYTRSKSLFVDNRTFLNSIDQYQNSQTQRFTDVGWGYICIGQFTSQDQINNYKVDIDGQGNKTLLPGDLIYKDVNGDGKINDLDQRPIGNAYGAQPTINFGFTIGANL